MNRISDRDFDYLDFDDSDQESPARLVKWNVVETSKHSLYTIQV